jgi:hypothetical protein
VPRNQGLYVAGVVDGRVILVGRHAVEALSLADGKRVWDKPADLGTASPSGRGIVTQGRLFLPVDVPEVIEIDLRDGSIAGAELDASPALKAALARFDTNQDGGISAAEIAARINAWKAMKTGLASIRCQLTLDGKPLPGATVTLTPEPFLGAAVKPASGTANQFGDVAPTISDADKPDPKLPGGVHFGLYTVKVEGGRESVPERYNGKSALGLEVSYDEPGIRDNNLAFRLKTAE